MKPSPLNAIGQRVLLALLVGIVGVAADASSSQGQQPAGRRIEVLFLGHTSRHHPSDSAAAFLVPALGKDGINFQYTTDPNDLNRENLAKYDALLVYANYPTITPSQAQALLEFVEEGNGYIPIHCASASFVNSPEIVALTGGEFDRHGTGTFTVPIIAPNHPVMQGLSPFETWDETYVHKNHNPEGRTVLMERVDANGREPWTWVRTQGKGRVFYTAYGHDGRTWSQPMFQKLVENGILWAVGDTVKARWAALDLPELQYVESSRIPNYERRNPPLKLQEPLSAEESMKMIQVPPGFELQLFAAEPDIVKPIAMAWDERGRLWIAETVDYPNNIHPGTPGGNDRIKILEDTDRDGRADKFTVFAEGLNVPTALTFADGGLVVAQMPDLILLKDTNGDDKADTREVLVSGFGYRDTHAGPSNLRYGFDNWIWGAVGYSAFEGVVGGDSLEFGQAIYRLRPDGGQMEHVANFSNNTWGLGFSETFDIFGSTANNTHAVFVGIPKRYSEETAGLSARFGAEKIDGHYAMAPITPNVRQVDVQGGFTAGAGFNLYTARKYPREYWNRIAFVNEPTGGVVHRAILEEEGAGFVEKDGWNLMAGADEWVGPVDSQVGPDGEVWVADWYNFIIQHNPTPPGFETGEGNAYENPLRDKTHGRIYRVVYKGSEPAAPMSLSAERPAELVRALEHENLFWRLTAQRLLVQRGNRDVVPQLIALVGSQRRDALGLSPGPLHALWTLHGLGQLDGSNAQATAAAVAALRHPAAGVRKAAAQVLPASAALAGQLRAAGLLEDADLHTRLAAVLRLSEVPASEELGGLLYRMSLTPEVAGDRWLADGVYVAAAQHRAGFLKAYAAALGETEYQALAARLAAEESAPRQFGQGGQGGQQAAAAAAEAAAARPLAERLLRAYVEDVVGPIERPQFAGGRRFGEASDEPVLALSISVVPGQMKYAVPEFTVKAGQRVRITLTNPDDMQHNLLIIRPGTIEAVGALADALVATPDAAERGYVPPTPDVMWYTPLVDPGKSQVLEFTAPRQAGDYPYLCSFPGHWRIMQGTMKVTD